MHRALEIPEVCSEILEHVPFSSLSNTLHLGLVCKAFLEHALDMLWRKFRSLSQLMKTFPQDSWEVIASGKIFDSGKIVFSRDLRENDFDRFDYYAKRVKSIAIETQHAFASTTFRPDMIRVVSESLALYRGARAWMPNLVQVICAHDISENFTVLDLIPFIHPRLQSVRFITNSIRVNEFQSSADVQTFLSALATTSPLVQKMEVWFQGSDPNPYSFPAALCDMRNLRTFTCLDVSVDWHTLNHLSSLPNLAILDCRVVEEDITLLGQHDIPSQPFPSLQSLVVEGPSRMFKEAILRKLLRGTKIESLSFKTTNSLIVGELNSIFSELCSRIHAEFLTSVSITQKYEEKDWDLRNCLHSRDFSPLFKLPNLQKVIVETDLRIDEVSDDLLEAMATTWPRLHTLHLGSPNYSEYESGFTLAGLSHLARGCKALQKLMIFFDTSAANVSHFARSARCPSLLVLWPGDSPVGDSLALASFLSGIFPNIKIWTKWDDHSLSSDLDDDDLWNKDRWEEVKRFHKAFVDVRREERKWLAGDDAPAVMDQQ